MSEATNLRALYHEAFPLDEAVPRTYALLEGPGRREFKSLQL